MERAAGVFTPFIRVMRREHLRDEARSGITKDCGCMRDDIDRRGWVARVPICRVLV